MLRTAVRLSPNFVIPLFGTQPNVNDYNKLATNIPDEPQTGWDRIKKMYSISEYHEPSVEMHNVGQAAMCGAFFGVAIGGFVQSRVAYLNFIENNQATIFSTTAEAKKQLQNYVTVAFAKGAYRWGWRLSMFTGIFSLVATTISVYQGNTSLIQYITAGAFTGALYKINLGLAATFVGALLGAALSTVGGLAILGVLKVTGVSMDDIRRSLYKLKEAREDQLNQAVEKAATIKNDALTKHHDVLVDEKGVVKIEELP